MTSLAQTFRAAVAWGLASGLLHPASAPRYRSDPKHRSHVYARRQARYAAGQTATGRPRRYHRHPELAGLPRRAYLTAYMRHLRRHNS